MNADVVMLSFDEPDANDLHHRLEQVLARPVKRLHGIVGMRRAYKLTAEAATTATYLLADGDFDPAAAGSLPAGVSMRCGRRATRSTAWSTATAG